MKTKSGSSNTSAAQTQRTTTSLAHSCRSATYIANMPSHRVRKFSCGQSAADSVTSAAASYREAPTRIESCALEKGRRDLLDLLTDLPAAAGRRGLTASYDRRLASLR